MGLYISGVLIVAYLGFVFFSEQLNPFRRPHHYVFRRRWRYGRKIGLAAGACALIAAVLYGWMEFAPAFALMVASGGFLMLWCFFFVQERSAEVVR